jgi:TolA-binding protein
MEPIADLGALRPVLVSLKAKGLVIALSPEGRGHVVAHALYMPRELENLRAQHSASASQAPPAPAAAVGDSPGAVPQSESSDELRRAVEDLRAQVAQLRSDVDDLASALQRSEQVIQRLRSELGA